MKRWIVPLALLIGLGVLYGSQLPGGYSASNYGADGGDLMAAVLTGGVPHPTGYPAYLLAAALFQQLPFGDPYWKGALLSLVCTVLAVFLVTQVSRPEGAESAAAGMVRQVAAGLAFGLAPAVWSQAVIVEVYALQAFFTACCLCWIQKVARGGAAKQNDPGIMALSVFVGLGLGNHVTLALLFPAVGWTAYIALRGGVPLRRLLKYAGLAAFAAALIYLILPLRALSGPPVNWGNPRDLSGLLWLASGRLYQGLVFGLPAGQALPRIAYLCNWLLDQFGVAGVFLGLAGAALRFIHQAPDRWADVWIFGASLVFSTGYLTNDSIVYLMPAVMVFALWIGSAAGRLWSGGTQALFHPVLDKLLAGALFVSLVASLPANYQAVDPRRDTLARTFAESCLNSLPEAAIVVTRGDQDTFPLWYYHYGLKYRPDVTLIAQGLAGFDWYAGTLRQAAPDVTLPAPDSPDWESALAQQNPGRPVCLCTGVLPESSIGFSCTGQ